MATPTLSRVRHRLAEAGYPIRYGLRFGFLPPPRGSVIARYDVILRTIALARLGSVPGDFLEIGCFMGGGSYMLSQFMRGRFPGRRLFVVDVFDPGFDPGVNVFGARLKEQYRQRLGGLSQRQVFDHVTRGCHNLTVLQIDSRFAKPETSALAFAIVDGNHEPEWVDSDWRLVWRLLSPGGVVAFDDYQAALPAVTATLNVLMTEHSTQIARKEHVGNLLFVTKR